MGLAKLVGPRPYEVPGDFFTYPGIGFIKGDRYFSTINTYPEDSTTHFVAGKLKVDFHLLEALSEISVYGYDHPVFKTLRPFVAQLKLILGSNTQGALGGTLLKDGSGYVLARSTGIDSGNAYYGASVADTFGVQLDDAETYPAHPHVNLVDVPRPSTYASYSFPPPEAAGGPPDTDESVTVEEAFATLDANTHVFEFPVPAKHEDTQTYGLKIGDVWIRGWVLTPAEFTDTVLIAAHHLVAGTISEKDHGNIGAENMGAEYRKMIAAQYAAGRQVVVMFVRGSAPSGGNITSKNAGDLLDCIEHLVAGVTAIDSAGVVYDGVGGNPAKKSFLTSISDPIHLVGARDEMGVEDAVALNLGGNFNLYYESPILTNPITGIPTDLFVPETDGSIASVTNAVIRTSYGWIARNVIQLPGASIPQTAVGKFVAINDFVHTYLNSVYRIERVVGGEFLLLESPLIALPPFDVSGLRVNVGNLAGGVSAPASRRVGGGYENAAPVDIGNWNWSGFDAKTNPKAFAVSTAGLAVNDSVRVSGGGARTAVFQISAIDPNPTTMPDLSTAYAVTLSAGSLLGPKMPTFEQLLWPPQYDPYYGPFFAAYGLPPIWPEIDPTPSGLSVPSGAAVLMEKLTYNNKLASFGTTGPLGFNFKSVASLSGFTPGDGTPSSGVFFAGSTLKGLHPYFPAIPTGCVETLVIRSGIHDRSAGSDSTVFHVGGAMETHVGKFPSTFLTSPSGSAASSPIGRLQFYNAACQENTQAYKELYLFEGGRVEDQGSAEHMPWISKRLVRFIDRVIANTHHNGDDRRLIEEVVGDTPRPKTQKYYGRRSNPYTNVDVKADEISGEDLASGLAEAMRAKYSAGLADD
jgi:hypothetical protein